MAPSRRRVLRTTAASLAAAVAGCVESEGLPETAGPATDDPEPTSSPDTTPTEVPPSATSPTDATETVHPMGRVSYDQRITVYNRYDTARTVTIRVEDAPESTDDPTVYHEETYTIAADGRERVFDFATLEAETGGDRTFAVYATREGQTEHTTIRTIACYGGVIVRLSPDDEFGVGYGIC